MTALWLTLCCLASPFIECPEALKSVQHGFLDLRTDIPLGHALDSHPMFREKSWHCERMGNRVFVFFQARFSYTQALKAFQTRHQYEWRFSLQAMQLQKVYKLGSAHEDELLLAFMFEAKAGSFHILGVRLGRICPKTGAVTFIPLSAKTIRELFISIYVQTDPLGALVRGLPYKSP